VQARLEPIATTIQIYRQRQLPQRRKSTMNAPKRWTIAIAAAQH